LSNVSGAHATNESNACGSTRASRSSSVHCTVMLARNVHTHVRVNSFVFTRTNTHDPRYWAGSGKAVVFPGFQTLAQWQEKGAGHGLGGQDKHSVVADPEFVNAMQNDFGLKPSSPALKMGFVPIDLTQVGPRPLQ
jgi:hypothetical protein